jgi:glycosyltransferase involved in cell wall biosynthesis
VVDGASQDNTLSLVEQCGLPVRLLSEPDKGLYDAMNKGMRMATGEYLIFLNAGDAFHAPDTLQCLAHAIGDSRPGVVYGETAIVDSERNFLMMRRLKAPEKLTWRSFKSGMLVCHQAFYAKRGIAPMYDLKYRLSGDVDWCIKVMKQAKKLVNVNATVVNYLQNGLSLQHHRASLKERFWIMSKHYGLLPTIGRHLWFIIRAVIKR